MKSIPKEHSLRVPKVHGIDSRYRGRLSFYMGRHITGMNLQDPKLQESVSVRVAILFSASIGLWFLVIVLPSWPLVEQPSQWNGLTFFAGIVLPLGTAIASTRIRSSLLFQCGLPLSFLPYFLLHPNQLSANIHGPWTFSAIAFLLWFILWFSHNLSDLTLPRAPQSHHTQLNRTVEWKSLVPTLIWFSGILLVLYSDAALDTVENERIVHSWKMIGVIFWSGLYVSFLRRTPSQLNKRNSSER